MTDLVAWFSVGGLRWFVLWAFLKLSVTGDFLGVDHARHLVYVAAAAFPPVAPRLPAWLLNTGPEGVQADLSH